MRKNVFIDLHVLETVPPSCVNRDDTGSPKTAVYGGAVRARVSSQCWKHAVRESFQRMLPQEDVGLRTKHIHELLTQAILARDPQAKAEKLAEEALKAAGILLKEDNKEEKKAKETEKSEKKTGALFFTSQGQIDALAELAVSGEKLEKKACQAALKAAPAVDIALFGRMVADDPSLNFDAAAQVAHAISTHTVHNEYDYFTAVDDCAPEDNAGAGHLGTVEYNSATLYRYATIHMTELQRLLGARTPEAVRAFIEAFIRSMPTGKINTFANNVLPNAVYVTIRCDQPVNLVGAFEAPVQAGNGGYVKASVEALVKHAKSVTRDFLGEPERAFAIGEGMEPLAETMPLSGLLDAVESAVQEIGGQA